MPRGDPLGSPKRILGVLFPETGSFRTIRSPPAAAEVSYEDLDNNLIRTMNFASTFGANLALAALVTFASAPAHAQDLIGDGFAQTGTLITPTAFGSYDTLSTGQRVYFDGISFDLYDGAGGFLLNLGSLPASVFNSFIKVDPTGTFAIAGESSNGDIFRIALDGSGFSAIANLNFNYDGEFEASGNILVSAALCGFGCGNDLLRVNTTSGLVTPLAHVSGYSGPVAVAGNGDLLYGTAGSSITNGSALLRFPAASLNGSIVLDETNATTMIDGLAGAASLAIDPVYGNLFLAESVFGGTSRLLEIDGGSGALADVVVESLNYLSTVELMQDAGIGHFHAYQPHDGVYLNYSNGDITTVRAQRPTSSLVQVGGAVKFEIQGAKPNAAMLVLFSNVSNYNPNYVTTVLGGTSFQFHSSVPVNKQRRTPLLVPIDANGVGTFSYFDPGSLAGTLVFQALITDESASFIGSSEAVLN